MKLLALLLFALAALAADKFAPFDPSQARTFSFRDMAVKMKTRAVREDRLTPVIRARIAARLQALGLTEAARGDVVVTTSLTVSSERRSSQRSRPSHRYEYRGMLLITIRSAKDGALLWNTYPSFTEDEPREFEEHLHRHVDRAIAKFPPKQK